MSEPTPQPANGSEPGLAEVRLDLGPAVPVALQRAVAAALAWVDALDRDAAAAGVRRPR